MEPLYFVMAIMGCGDAATNCQQARIEPVRYQSAAACQAAMPSALERSTDLSFPVVQAACERRGMTMADRRVGAPRG
jgi:hypothetical protein